MRKIFLAVCLFLPTYIYSQEPRTRYGVGLTPTGKRNVTIHGLAIGVMAHAKVGGHLKVNGLNVEILPVAVFTVPGSMFATMLNVALNEYYENKPEMVNTEIHGLSISGGLFEEVAMDGVSLNINSYASYSRGFELTMFMNSNYWYSGVQASVLGNRAVEGNGVQVGLFNSCQNCRGIQIGFLNRMGSRVLPIINFSFGKRNKVGRKHYRSGKKH